MQRRAEPRARPLGAASRARSGRALSEPGVPHQLGHLLPVRALLDQERGIRVPEIVETEAVKFRWHCPMDCGLEAILRCLSEQQSPRRSFLPANPRP